ncbi:MAG: hypothetical protein VB078_08985 [Clostridiaceae bacterium]|nr:hypothetical protein [Clostridiaceae bacterium]
MYTLDTQYLSAAVPVFKKYISDEKYDYVVEYGTAIAGTYEELITNINY